MNINENLGNDRKNAEIGIILIELIIAQLLVVLNCQTWFKIDAKTQFLYPFVQYTNDLSMSYRPLSIIGDHRTEKPPVSPVSPAAGVLPNKEEKIIVQPIIVA